MVEGIPKRSILLFRTRLLPLKRIRRVSELLQIDPTDNHVAERRVRRRGGGDHPWVAALPWMAGHQNSHTVCGPDIHAIRGGPVRARIDAVANEGRFAEHR